MTLIHEIIAIALCVSIAFGGMLIATERKQEIMWSVTILAMTAIILAVIAKENNNLYPATMSVVQLNTEEDLVTIQTATGLTYQFYGIEDYNLNDAVSLIMDSKGTESVLDDEIIKAQYSGFRKAKGGAN